MLSPERRLYAGCWTNPMALFSSSQRVELLHPPMLTRQAWHISQKLRSYNGDLVPSIVTYGLKSRYTKAPHLNDVSRYQIQRYHLLAALRSGHLVLLQGRHAQSS